MRASVRWWALVVLVAGVASGCGDSASDDGAGSDGGAHEGHDAAEPSTTALDDEGDGPAPAAQYLPEPSGTCPGFVAGELCEEDGVSLICTFEPEGVPARKVRLWLPEGAADDDAESPVVFFFHGMGGMASNANTSLSGIGQEAIDAINAEGGIVIALEKEEGRVTSATSQPWKTAVQDGLLEADQEGRFDDMTVMDEVLACAEATLGVNSRRIHATGMSAGGLMTTNLIYRRNGYLASLAPFSGGVMGNPAEQDTTRKPPVMYSWGGESDLAVGQNFNTYAISSIERLGTNGNYLFTCNHGGGHTLNAMLPLPMWEFFKSHPYGTDPEPYAGGLPDGEFPDFCVTP
jgi:poly(3-hydroxybutyrate) depolymerase